MKPPWYEKDKWKTAPFPKHFKSEKSILNLREMKIKNEEGLTNNFYAPIFPKISEEREVKSMKGKSQKDKTQIYTKVKGYKLNITIKQKRILKKWGEIDTLIYNECVDLYNDFLEFLSLDIGEYTLTFNGNERKVDTFTFGKFTELKMLVFDKLFAGKKKEAPYDILSGTVKTFCANLSAAKTNFKNGNSSHFRMKRRSEVKSYSFYLEKRCFKMNGFYVSLFGEIKDFDQVFKKFNKLGDICDSVLVFNFTKDCTFLKVTYSNPIETLKRDKNRIVAIDPGLNHPLCFYSLSNIGYIGSGFKSKILHIQHNIKNIQSGVDLNTNRKSQKLRNRRNLFEKLKKSYQKIKNHSKELRGLAGKFLTENYDVVLFPTFGSSGLISTMTRDEKKAQRKAFLKIQKDIPLPSKGLPQKSDLSKRNRFITNAISPYALKIHVKNKCHQNNVTFIEVTEEFTSQCCGNCGELSKVYSIREKRCPFCGTCIDRDINAARNIFLKNVSLTGLTGNHTKVERPRVSV